MYNYSTVLNNSLNNTYVLAKNFEGDSACVLRNINNFQIDWNCVRNETLIGINNSLLKGAWMILIIVVLSILMNDLYFRFIDKNQKNKEIYNTYSDKIMCGIAIFLAGFILYYGGLFSGII